MHFKLRYLNLHFWQDSPSSKTSKIPALTMSDLQFTPFAYIVMRHGIFLELRVKKKLHRFHEKSFFLTLRVSRTYLNLFARFPYFQFKINV